MTRNVLRLPAMKAKLGLQRTQIKKAEAEAREGRGDFPQSFPILEGGRARGWLESEVDQYLETRAANRVADTTPPPAPAIPNRRQRQQTIASAEPAAPPPSNRRRLQGAR